jgi:hypothetical protein
MKLSRFITILLVVLPVSVLLGCGDKSDTNQPQGVVAQKSAPDQSLMSAISTDQTRALFGLATNVDVSDKDSLFDLRKDGILIHPGETRPTKVSFKLSRSYQKLNIRPFIATLPPEATAIKEAGTVGVEFLLDGNSAGKFMVDRDSNNNKTLDLTNVDILTIIVDNGDGKHWFDWFMFGVVDSK